MAFDSLPPWIAVSPGYFTSALEAGARAGLAVSEQAQRAQALAEARAERAAQAQERADRAAQQQQQFEETRLLNVQKIAQDAQQLQQQIAHQTAQEQQQASQESRLLDYNKGLLDYHKGQLAVENRRADFAEKQAEPSTLDINAAAVLDPITGKRVGLMTRSGPRTQHFILDPVDKGLTPPQQASIYNAQERSVLNQLEDINMLSAAKDTKHPQRPLYNELQSKLQGIRQNRDALVASKTAPTVLSTNAPAIRGATGPIHSWPKSKSELVIGDLYEHPVNGVGRWNGKVFEAVEVR